MEFIKVGEVKLGSKTRVTDPSYDKDTHWAYLEVPTVSGNYDCFVGKDKEDKWATTYACRIIKQGYQHFRDTLPWEYLDRLCVDAEEVLPWEYLGRICVDAGLAGFFNEKPDYSNSQWQKICDDIYELDKKDTADFNHYGVYQLKSCECDNFFTSSGYGDGVYYVFGIEEGDACVALEIIFIDDDLYESEEE